MVGFTVALVAVLSVLGQTVPEYLLPRVAAQPVDLNDHRPTLLVNRDLIAPSFKRAYTANSKRGKRQLLEGVQSVAAGMNTTSVPNSNSSLTGSNSVLVPVSLSEDKQYVLSLRFGAWRP